MYLYLWCRTAGHKRYLKSAEKPGRKPFSRSGRKKNPFAGQACISSFFLVLVPFFPLSLLFASTRQLSELLDSKLYFTFFLTTVTILTVQDCVVDTTSIMAVRAQFENSNEYVCLFFSFFSSGCLVWWGVEGEEKICDAMRCALSDDLLPTRRGLFGIDGWIPFFLLLLSPLTNERGINVD